MRDPILVSVEDAVRGTGGAMPRNKIAALQLAPSIEGKEQTLRDILDYEERIRAAGVKLVVLPEAIIGGYPKGESFGTSLGHRLPEGREAFARYFRDSIVVPGAETQVLADLSTRCDASLVVGVVERDRSTLYCTALIFLPGHGLVAKHRKLMPTGGERLVWGQGDGSTLPVIETKVGLVGAVNCWENYMPLLRTAMYAKGVQIWCAPTIDEREMWLSSMRHIAHEGRCFVVSACQVQSSPAEMGRSVPGWDEKRALINGGSVIVGPLGDVLAGPLRDEAGLVVADVDIDDLIGARYDFDVVGHYSRPDVFTLVVNEKAQRSVSFTTDPD